MILIGIIILFIFVIIIIFSFPQFSPVPYFPSNIKDMSLILKALNVRANQTIIDLGAGDGVVIFKAAEEALEKKLNTQFVAVEINPVLLLILHIRRLFHANRKNIHILNKDMFTMDFKRYTLHATHCTFYIYISPWFIEKTVQNIIKQLPSFDLVSYFYHVKYLPKYKEEVNKGVHTIYKYSQSKR